jgi:hypothetical protein
MPASRSFITRQPVSGARLALHKKRIKSSDVPPLSDGLRGVGRKRNPLNDNVQFHEIRSARLSHSRSG